MEGCEEEPLRLGSQEVNRGVHTLFGSKLEETAWTHSYQSPGGLALDSCGSYAVDLSPAAQKDSNLGVYFQWLGVRPRATYHPGCSFPIFHLEVETSVLQALTGFDGPQDVLFVQKGL